MTRKILKMYSSLKRIIFFVTAVILVLGFITSSNFEKRVAINPEELLKNALNSERYISTDDLADRIINQDPSLVLIDVRDSMSFKRYSLTEAMNIPLKEILNEESKIYLNQNRFDVVLFSNDNLYADQAWMLCNRLGYKNLHVLEGGINTWFHTIINPPKPTEEMPDEAFKLYDVRKGASMYFGVEYPKKLIQPKKLLPKKVITVKKKKKMPIEGGC